jgi:hypothetical protein
MRVVPGCEAPVGWVSVPVMRQRRSSFLAIGPLLAIGHRRIRLTLMICVCAGLLLATAAPAPAQNPTYEGYSPTVVITPPPPPARSVLPYTDAKKSGSTLPFTGADVGAVVLAALILLVLGAVLRRSTREQS